MKLTEMFLAELEREAKGTQAVLERVPDGHYDWKPHEKSMSFGRLSNLVASMPSWLVMMIDQNELDINPPGGSSYRQAELRTSRELVEAHAKHVAAARKSLTNTTDEHLMKNWKLLAGGKVVSDQPRYIVLRDTFNHLAHHRGQLTVYLRLNNASVPAIYGPSADEGGFN